MKLSRFIIIFLIFITVWAETPGSGDIKLNIKNMGIRQFVEMIGKITEKNILINSDLKGKINFISNRPIRKESLFSLANSILSSKGYALIDHGDFMEVVRASEAAGKGLPVSESVRGETMKTVLFPLKNSSAAVIRAKIRPLLGKNAKVVSFKENNLLAVTAYPKTLRSIKTLIDAIENTGNKGSVVIKLQHASVKDIYSNAVNMAKELFPQTIPGEKVGIYKDEPSNSIIIVGKKKNVEQMVKYIKQLDRKGESINQKMYVIPLKNSNVEDMEKILGKLVAQMNNMSLQKLRKRPGGPPQKAMVVADKERNSLIVLATGEQYRNIMQVLRRIDVEKPQVYIRARVVEINSKLAQEIGAKYGLSGGVMTPHGIISIGANFTGGSSNKLARDLQDFIGGDDTDNKPTFNNVKALFSLGVQLNLYKNDGAAHILSEPSILCTNNQESELFVGETRSILVSSASGDNQNDLTRNNFERKDIGLTLKVKPRLSSNNKVALTVDAIIEDVDDSSGYNSPTPTTYKRKVTTNAIVQNGQTVIIGGLMKNIAGASTNAIPLLGDIPIIGRLFRDEGKAQRKVDLVIYLTPFIVRHSRDLAKLRKFLSELEEIQLRYTQFIKERIDGDGNGESGMEYSQQAPSPSRQNNGNMHHHKTNKALDILRTRP